MRKLEHSGIAGDASRGRVAGAGALIRKHWLVFAAIGIAVLGVIAGVLASGQATPTSARVPPAVATVRGVPRYYVALDTKGRIGEYAEPLAEATVRVTATGAVIARVFAPRPYLGFVGVTGAAANDRTFVLLAHGPTNPFTGQVPERFFVLRIDPDARSATARARLTALPASDTPSGESDASDGVVTLALSPDGRSLAAIQNITGVDYLYVYNLATGQTRRWVKNPCEGCAPAALSNPIGLNPGVPDMSFTSDDSSVAFTFMYNLPQISYQLRLLHLGGQGNDVVTSSTPFLFHAPATSWRQAVMTPDGKTVLMTVGFVMGGQYSEVRISTATGQATPINTLQPTAAYSEIGPLTVDTILWTNDNGSTVVIADAMPGRTLGVYSGRKYTPLPWPPDAVAAAW